jgi:hypothetical protein
MENLFLEVLERSTERLIARQHALYGAEGPFIDKWRTAMGYLDADFAAGYPKIVAELEALAWNRPELLTRVVKRNMLWRGVLTETFSKAMADYGLSPEQFPLEVMVSLAMTFQRGIFAERLIGIKDGHEALLTWIDHWLVELEEGRCDASLGTS